MRYRFGDYTLDTQCYALYQAGRQVPLRRKVFQVLAYLLTHRDRVVSKEELLAHGWPGQFLSDETLSSCITAARQAVGDSGAQQAVIQTRRGYGYCFVAAVEEDAVAPGTRAAVPPAPIQMEPLAAAAVVPAAVRGPGAAKQTQPEAERRQVTLLFCDLVDSTGLAGQLDPEDYRAVLQAYLETCATVIARFGGNLAKFLGDGALVCFGYPQAHDDDPQQAVRAGLGIVEALTQGNTRLAQTWGVQLAVRIGIHTGLVVAGDLVVGENRTPQVVVGEAPNIAARLQDLAASNTVVCSAATARLVEGYFVLEALGPQVLKGVATPLPVYRVVDESWAQTRFDVALTRGLTPLAGREPELALLRERWAQTVDGQGQVVVLNGEPGIGKSRLVQELTAHLAGTAHTLLAYHCSPYYQQTAFYPVVTALQQLLRRTPAEPAAAQLQRLEALLASSGLPLAEVVPLVAALLEIPPPAHYPPLALTSQLQRSKTLETLVAWVLAATQRQPVLCVVEDLHWVDPTTLEWLGLLVAHAPTARLLMLLACRPEFRLPWPLHAHLTSVTLRRLPVPQVEQLIGHVARGTALSHAVVQQIATQTDGVPLFVEELTKTVLEAGEGQTPEEGTARSRSLPALAIPATLQDSLMARLDRLPTGKVVVQLGATIGRTFAGALLQAVTLLDEAAVQDGLRQLVAAELVYPRGVGAEATYAFKHALIQEAAYQSLLKRTRQQYHQRIAQVLEAQFPDVVETQPELLAHHYTAAGLNPQAVSYGHKAAQRAIERSAYVEAISHLRTGLALLQTVPETLERVQREVDMHIALGASLIATQGYTVSEVEQTYARARQLCQHLEDPHRLSAVLRGLWMYYVVCAKHQTAHELGEQLLTLAQQVQDATMLLVAHQILGTTWFFMGAVAAAHTHYTQSITHYHARQHHSYAFLHGAEDGVTCLSRAAWVLWYLGYPDQAGMRSHEAVTLAQQTAHPLTRTSVLGAAAMFHQFRRAMRATQEYAEALIGLTTDKGFPFWLALGWLLRGWVLTHQGQAQEGIEQMTQGCRAFRATTFQSYALTLLAEAYGTIGAPEAGLGLLTEALTLADTPGEQWYASELYRLKGVLLLQQSSSNHTAVESCFHHAINVSRSQQAKSLELRAATSLARLWHQQGKHQEAHDLLAPIYHWFTEGWDTADLQDAKALLEELGG